MFQEVASSLPKPTESSSSECVSEFAHLYKNYGKGPDLSQQERRNVLLKDQKESRHRIVDTHRDFSKVFLDDESDNIGETSNEQQCEEMEVDRENSIKREHSFFLMRSEWFTEVPPDLEDNWLVKLAPDGFRVLLIAKKNKTTLVNERGKVLMLKTHLPGGGLSRIRGLTVLDCIYSKTMKKIFILDCLYWNTMSMLDSETTFRFYWLKNQFDETTKLTETNKPHKLEAILFFPAEKSLIQQKVFESPPEYCSGVVFYHKELQYIFKQTPLLGWLYSYMLPEKLGIDIPNEILQRMPKGYQCLEKYLEEKNSRKDQYQPKFKDKRVEDSKNMDTM
ncbi:hypothetical protein ABEB36_001352 [Hypothenemus hampei]|uniref:Snurportin-1 n=1 Tax=Hypothenemus hampei TaxID=57062 RepID=A0ABD1FEB7_HYPHA